MSGGGEKAEPGSETSHRKSVLVMKRLVKDSV